VRQERRNRHWFINVARETMDEKSINLWRQIEGARRIGKRTAIGRSRPGPPPGRRDIGG
jgi:hypothetical protein